MPEGDTVWLAAGRLHAALAGRRLDRFELRVPNAATADLRGEPVMEVVARGKHLLTRIGTDWTLHTHLRMDGAWRLYARGQPWRGAPAHQIRAVLGVLGVDAVGYRLPVVELLRRDREHRAVGYLGPDLLGPDWDPVRALANLLTEPTREIGLALLDQRVLAGLGNLYRNELCFLRGVHPWRSTGSVPDLPGLLARGRDLLMANRAGAAQRTTGRSYPAHWVFERAGRPCLRCGTPVRSRAQGSPPRARRTYWCPTCQPAS